VLAGSDELCGHDRIDALRVNRRSRSWHGTAADADSEGSR